jgi:hypothetical protein
MQSRQDDLSPPRAPGLGLSHARPGGNSPLILARDFRALGREMLSALVMGQASLMKFFIDFRLCGRHFGVTITQKHNGKIKQQIRRFINAIRSLQKLLRS